MARLTGSLREAVMLASEVPARIVGGRDAWCVGARADVLRFHWQPGDTAIRPVSLHIQGQPVLDRRQRPR